MIDIEKERVAFEEWYENAIGRSLVYKTYDKSYLNSKTQEAWETWQAAKVETHKQVALYQFEINHLAQANQQWRERADEAPAVPETQQAVIDELKAQLKAVHDSRVEFVEYCRVVEAPENKG